MARARRRPARTGDTATGRDAGPDADRATGNLAFRVSELLRLVDPSAGHAFAGVWVDSVNVGSSRSHTTRRADYARGVAARPTRTRRSAVADIDIEARTRVSVPDDWSDLDRRAVDTIRVLAADAVQKVGNGHPGTAMSLAPLAYSLFQRVMRHDPSDADWPGRDRFVLSCGPLVDHAVHPALPLRLRPGDVRPEVAAHVGLQDPGPPRARAHPRRRDHHRPAGPGPRLRRRHGDGGASRARPVRPGPRLGRLARSTTTST